MSKLKDLNRRELLKFLGVASSSAMLNPLNLLTQSIIGGIATKAYAGETSLNPRRLLYIQLPGAPARWTFDFFLNPYDSPGFISNAHANTKYISNAGRYTSAEYKTVLMKGIHVPWMWQFDLPTANGGTRPMSDLLDHLLALQGLNSGNDSHDISRANIFTPLGAMQSFTALPGDAGDSPIKAASCNASLMVYKSKKGFSNINIPNGGSNNLIQDLMAPFTSTTNATFNTKKSQLKNYLDASTLSLKNFAQSEHPGAASLAADQKSANDLLATALSGISTYWTATVAKYDSIIKRALDVTNELPGLTDLPVGTDLTRGVTYRIDAANTPAAAADLRTMVPTNGAMGQLARHMALAEYLFVNKLTHSLTIAPGTFASTDEHNVGAMVSLIQNTYSWRAYAACLLELITQFKANNIFQDTVIAVVGDFNRNPRVDGAGSDHRATASSGVFYSGAIQGPMVLGRMQAKSGKSGSIGDGDSTRDYANLLSSSATLLRVPSPVTAKPSMVAEVNGVITAAAEKATLY